MPRKLRLEYLGAIYHVMSRANGKGNIFETDVDRQDFVKTLAETCAKAGFQVHAYCLMPEFQVKNTHYISFLTAKVCGPQL